MCVLAKIGGRGYLEAMRLFKVPEHRAIGIIWAALFAWCALMTYATGWDGLIPVAWPLVFAIYFTWRILKTKRARLAWEAENPTAANISQKPTSVRESGK